MLEVPSLVLFLSYNAESFWHKLKEVCLERSGIWVKLFKYIERRLHKLTVKLIGHFQWMRLINISDCQLVFTRM